METENTTTEVPADTAAGAPEGLAGGVLDGGWSFIWAAYFMTWTFLGGYAIYVNVRRFLSARAVAEAEAHPRRD